MPHTAADKKESVLLNLMPEVNAEYAFDELYEKWNRLFELRDDVMKALEIARADKLIGKSLDAKVTVYAADDETYALLDSFKSELATVYIVSDVELVKGAPAEGAFTETASGIGVLVSVAEGEKCDRCWMHSKEGEKTEDGFICSRCLAVING